MGHCWKIPFIATTCLTIRLLKLRVHVVIPFVFPKVMQLSDGNILSSQLTIDAMGNFSPVVKQVKFYLVSEKKVCNI